MFRVLSLGAGVQSTTVALMSAAGDLPPVDAAIFSDTRDEPKAVYAHLAQLRAKLPFPVYLTARGNMRLSEALLAGDDQARIPFFVKAGGLSTRQCTRNFKIRPIRKKVRELIERPGRAYIAPGAVECWVGISTDEASRMKPAGVNFMVNRFPLIEKGMSRRDCERWLLGHGHPVPPKSACTYCPFQADAQHQERIAVDPEAHAFNIAFDRALRSPENVARFRGELYVHRSRVPLDQVDFSIETGQGDLFTNECEGMCGN